MEPIVITKYAQASATTDFFSPQTDLKKHLIGESEEWAGKLNTQDEARLLQLLEKYPHYKKLDRSVQLALCLADKTDFSFQSNERVGVNIGSSRGATHLWEKDFEKFQQENQTQVLTSPTTSLGNLSAWVGQHLDAKGVRFNHSMTCSTSLLSVLNAVAWLRSGMVDCMIAGGAEAPLTPFTIAQSKALRIYSQEEKQPSLAGYLGKERNTMVLGEAAGLLQLQRKSDVTSSHSIEIAGIGYASEPLKSMTGISEDAENLQESMRMALEDAGLNQVDGIVAHTPGTRKGDEAEYRAIEKVFKTIPLVTNNKWKTGHTFGAAGALSLIYALEMLHAQKWIPLPFDNQSIFNQKLETIMVNAAGFGGNAVSIIVKLA